MNRLIASWRNTIHAKVLESLRAESWRNKIHAKAVESLRAEGKCPSCGQPPVLWVVRTHVGWCANKDCAVLTFSARLDE